MSRLDPPPIPRRDFLGAAAFWSAVSALGLSLIGLLRMPKTAVLPSPSKKFTLKLPDFLPAGQVFVPQGRNVGLVRDANQQVHAISLVCTHLGCIVKPVSDGFRCPCHGSAFGKDGAVVGGPAPKGLAWYHVAADEDGTLVVDEGRTIPPAMTVVMAKRAPRPEQA